MSTRAPVPELCNACALQVHEDCSGDVDLDVGPPCSCSCRDVREPFAEGEAPR